MQQNGQEQKEQGQQPETTGHTEMESEPNTVTGPTEAEQRLSAEQQKVEECMDLLRRTQADFINYRRRTGQEQAEGRIAAQSAVLAQLLPVLDDLQRALNEVPPELESHPWVQGMRLVARRISTLFDQMGIQQIGSPGEQFDPRRHEAIDVEMRSDVPEGTILRVTRPGYLAGERVIRPAQVVVARNPTPSREEQEQHGEAPSR
jgi:molecular chaperone GrpE